MDYMTCHLTKDAEIKVSKKSQKQFVFFRVAENLEIVDQSSGEITKSTKYYNCFYWQGLSAVEHLKKGVKVHLAGEESESEYKADDGTNTTNYMFNVKEIFYLTPLSESNTDIEQPQTATGKHKATRTTRPKKPKEQPAAAAATNTDTADDLPF